MLLFILILGLQFNASSQTILNGSFESDTSFHCDDSYHFLPSFQSEFYDILDYCDYVNPIMEFPLELRLIIDTCTYNNGQPVLYEESVPDGYFSIAFQSTLFPDDFGYQSGFTMQLSDLLEEGRHYKLSFYKTRQDTVLQVPLIHSYFLPPLIAVNQGISSDSIYDDGPEYTDAVPLVPLVGKGNRRGRATAPAVGRGLFDYVQVRVCYEPTRTDHKKSQKIRCFTSHSFFSLCMLQQPV
jgi:hypothetical protein